MKHAPEREEYLERLWTLIESGGRSFREYRESFGGDFQRSHIDELQREGLISLSRDEKRIGFTLGGRERTKILIRSHRIAERLINDVLGGDFEAGACEFEHTASSELVDSICTLLGHPKECPHGFSIPPGDCCRNAARTLTSIIKPLTELAIGEIARIAYVYSENDQQLHRLDSLQLRPGSLVRLHQRYPSYVIECEGTNIALDAAVAAGINVYGSDRVEGAERTRERRRGRRASGRPYRRA